MMVELEDILGALFSRIKPDLERIGFRLFRIESHLEEGILTPASFLGLMREVVELRFVIENLPLIPGDASKIIGGQSGVRMAS